MRLEAVRLDPRIWLVNKLMSDLGNGEGGRKEGKGRRERDGRS